MLKKSLCLALVCSLLFCCVCCSSSSGSVKRYTYGDLSYSAPASWNADVDDPDLTFMQWSDADGGCIYVSKYEADSPSRGKLFEWLNDDGVSYDVSDVLISSQHTVHGAVYEKDGAAYYIYPVTASNGDEYRLTFILKEPDEEFVASVMSSVDIG